jgi:hypothetical protein
LRAFGGFVKCADWKVIQEKVQSILGVHERRKLTDFGRAEISGAGNVAWHVLTDAKGVIGWPSKIAVDRTTECCGRWRGVERNAEEAIWRHWDWALMTAERANFKSNSVQHFGNGEGARKGSGNDTRLKKAKEPNHPTIPGVNYTTLPSIRLDVPTIPSKQFRISTSSDDNHSIYLEESLV